MGTTNLSFNIIGETDQPVLDLMKPAMFDSLSYLKKVISDRPHLRNHRCPPLLPHVRPSILRSPPIRVFSLDLSICKCVDHFLKQPYPRRRWLLRPANCVYMSTLNSIFLILPRCSVSASTGWGYRGRRTAAVSGDNGDGGPGTTGNIEWCGQIAEAW